MNQLTVFLTGPARLVELARLRLASLAASLRRRSDRRRLLKLIDRHLMLGWVLEHVTLDSETLDQVTREFGLVCAELVTRGWWQAMQAHRRFPLLVHDGEELPCPEDVAGAEAAAIEAAGLADRPRPVLVSPDRRRAGSGS